MAEAPFDPHAHVISMGKSVALKRRQHADRVSELNAAQTAVDEALEALENAERGMKAAVEQMIGEIDRQERESDNGNQ